MKQQSVFTTTHEDEGVCVLDMADVSQGAIATTKTTSLPPHAY